LATRYAQPGHALTDMGVARRVSEGLRYIRTRRAIVATFAVTVIFNMWGFPYISMIPVIGEKQLGLTPPEVGMLMSAEGLGALLGALTIAYAAKQAYFTRIYGGGLCLFLTAVLTFSLNANYGAALVILFIGGFGFAGFHTMQSSLPLMITEAAFRSRVMGVLAFCIGAAPIGILHVGFMADWLGASRAVTLIAIEGLVALGLALFIWPELRRPPRPAVR
jgi:predicted MFS family arabinose efflux permease